MVAAQRRKKAPRGQTMVFIAVFLAVVVIPILILAVDVVRAFDVRTRLQTAADAACQAAVQAMSAPTYQGGGAEALEPARAQSQAYREFNGTVRDAGLVGYSPRVAVSIIGPTRARCDAVAEVETFIPGAPQLRVHATAISDARAERH